MKFRFLGIVNKVCTEEPSILVLVTKKISLNCLPNNGLIPDLYKGIKTDVIETGTLGYIVTDNEQVSKTYCFLSTNLIFEDGNKAPIGTNIIQPSNEYGGDDPKNIIAKLLIFVALKFTNKVPDLLVNFNTVDCAAASFVNVGEVELINPFIPEIGAQKGISDLGALACDSDKNALGLIFASSGPMNFFYNLISNISNIQNELKVTLLTVKI